MNNNNTLGLYSDFKRFHRTLREQYYKQLNEALFQVQFARDKLRAITNKPEAKHFSFVKFVSNPNYIYNTTVYKSRNPIDQVIQVYAKLYTNNLNACNKLTKKLEQLKVFNNVTYEVFTFIIEKFNFELSKIVLDGYAYRMPLQLGMMYIYENYNADKYVDWKASLDYRKRLIEEGRVPYKQDTAPHGEFWIKKYDTETNYFWKWKKYSFTKNIQFFIFTPTAFINTDDRNHFTYLNTVTSKEDILNDNRIGNRDKIYSLIRHNKYHKLKYRENTEAYEPNVINKYAYKIPKIE